ncbi:hypothetical protein ACJ2A9_04925 [Anaerobacillus sp. MEB173]|uniref:hypothetical protein n=1 Tax=Anaerobacillus sp. MEB173 TaxID=3383345 RepID=UPI003F935400
MEQIIVENVIEEVVNAATKRQRYKDLAISRVGETRLNRLGSMMIVDEYNNSQDIWVRFPQGNMVKCTWTQFLAGNVKNVWDRSLYGVGYIGEGKYKISVNGVPTKIYKVWASMIQRCYSVKLQEKCPTYKGVTVCDEWHNFQNFAKWYDANIYDIEGCRMELDKDILCKGNKVYSPDTCVFVPHHINNLFVKRDKLRGDLPIGVKLCSRYDNKYEARCSNNKGQRVYIGRYNTPEEAFQAYKEYKEKLIKEVAEEFKGYIPNKLYTAMLDYKVDIND